MNIIPVILLGGSGARLWSVLRKNHLNVESRADHALMKKMTAQLRDDILSVQK